jgi:hypothetical protein
VLELFYFSSEEGLPAVLLHVDPNADIAPISRSILGFRYETFGENIN